MHAFSHLLAKNGRAKNINNLVGQIDFAEDVIQRKQDQLDEAGVALPVFSDVGSALEKHLTVEQSNFSSYKECMASFKGDVDQLVKLQSLIRRHLAKKEFQKMLCKKTEKEDNAIKIQAAVRGLLARKKLELTKNSISLIWMLRLQSVIRGYLLRRNMKKEKQLLLNNVCHIIKVLHVLT